MNEPTREMRAAVAGGIQIALVALGVSVIALGLAIWAVIR